MADLNQQAPAQGPQGLFDLVKRIEQGTSLRTDDGLYDPVKTAEIGYHELMRMETSGEAPLPLEKPDEAWQQYAQAYNNDRAKFDVDYKHVENLAKVVRSMPSEMRTSIRYGRALSAGEIVRLQWNKTDPNSVAGYLNEDDRRPWHNNKSVALFNSGGEYFDWAGRKQQLSKSVFDNKVLYLDAELGPYGTISGPATIRELVPGESPFTRDMYSTWGAPSYSDTDTMDFAKSFLSRLGPNTDALFEEMGKFRLNLVEGIYDITGKDRNGLTYDEAVKAGKLTSFWRAMTFGEDIEGALMSANYDASHLLYEKFLEDPEGWVAKAKAGDKSAFRIWKAARMFDGEDSGSNYAQNLADQLYAHAARWEHQSTYEAERGIDGDFAGMLGDGAAQLLQQILVTRGVGSLVLKGAQGSGALSRFMFARNLSGQQELSTWGARLLRGVGTGLPASQVWADSYEEARKAGYDPDQSVMFGGVNAAVMMTTESIIGTPYLYGAFTGGGRRVAQEAIREELGALVRDGGGNMIGASMRAMGKFVEQLPKMGQNLVNRYPNSALAGHAASALSGFFREGTQETLEELGNYMNERIHDEFKLGGGKGYFGTKDQDLSDRLSTAFLVGGILGGTAGSFVRTAPRQDGKRTVMHAVVDGYESDVRKHAASLLKQSLITQEAHDSILETIAFTKDVMAAYGYTDPHLYESENADGRGRSISKDYADRALALKEAEDRLNSAKAELDAADEKSKAPIQQRVVALESSLKSAQDAMAEFTSGSRSMKAMKDFAIWQAYRTGKLQAGINRADVRVPLSAGIDAFLSQGPNGILETLTNLSIESGQARQNVKTQVEQLSKAIDALGKGSLAPENKIDELVDELKRENGLRRQDIESLRAGVSKMKEVVFKETGVEDKAEQEEVEEWLSLGAIDMTGMDPDNPSSGPSEAQKAAFEKLLPLADLKSAKEGLGPDPSNLKLDGDPLGSELEWFFTTLRNPSAPDDTMARVTIDDFTRLVKEAVEFTPEQAERYLAAVDALSDQVTSMDVLSTVYPELADKMTAREQLALGSQKGSTWNGKLGEAYAKFKQEAKTYGDALSKVAVGDRAQQLYSRMDEIRGIVNSKTVNSRQRILQLNELERSRIKLHAAMIAELLASGGIQNRMTVALINKNQAELAKVLLEADPAKSNGPALALLAQMEEAISEEISRNPERLPEITAAWLDNKPWVGHHKLYTAPEDWAIGKVDAEGKRELEKSYGPGLLNDNMRGSRAFTVAVAWLQKLATKQSKLEDLYAKAAKGIGLTWEQEEVIKHIISLDQSRQWEAFESMVKLPSIRPILEQTNAPDLLRNAVTVMGSAGVGKTYLAQALLRYTLQRPGAKVLFVAPGRANLKTVQENLGNFKGAEGSSIEFKLLSDLLEMSREEVASYTHLVFDEAHGLGQPQVDSLAALFGDNKNQFRVFMGDPAQVVYSDKDFNPMRILRYSMHTDVVMTQMRQGNEALGQSVDRARSAINLGTEPSAVFKNETIYSPTDNTGVRQINSIEPEPLYDAFAEHHVNHPDAVLVVANDAQRLQAIAHLAKHKSLSSKYSMDQVGEHVLSFSAGPHSASGLTAGQVFVSIPVSEPAFSKLYYTAITRAVDLLVTHGPGAQSRPVSKVAYTKLSSEVLNDIRALHANRRTVLSGAIPSEGAAPDVAPKSDEQPPTDTGKPTGGTDNPNGYADGNDIDDALTPNEDPNKRPDYLDAIYDKTGLGHVVPNTFLYSKEHPKARLEQLRKAVMSQVLSESRFRVVVRRGKEFTTSGKPQVFDPVLAVEVDDMTVDRAIASMGEEVKPEERTLMRMVGALPVPKDTDVSKYASVVNSLRKRAETMDDGDVLMDNVLPSRDKDQGLFARSQYNTSKTSVSYPEFVQQALANGLVVSRPRFVRFTKKDGTTGRAPAIRLSTFESSDGSSGVDIFMRPDRLTESDIDRATEELASPHDLHGSLAQAILRQNAKQALDHPEMSQLVKVYDGSILDFAREKPYESALQFLELMRAEVVNGEKVPYRPFQINKKDGIIVEEDASYMVVDERAATVTDPRLLIDIGSALAKPAPDQNGTIAPLGAGDPFAYGGETSEVMGEMPTATIEEAVEMARRIFGRRFLDSMLEFTPNPIIINGRSKYAAMVDGRMLIRYFDGNKVHAKAVPHEAVHFALEHMLSKESRDAILAEAKSILAAGRGISPDAVSTVDAHEYMADLYEQKPPPTTLLGRFLSWLRHVVRRLKNNLGRVDELIYQLNTGEFVDKQPNVGPTIAFGKDMGQAEMDMQLADKRQNLAIQVLGDSWGRVMVDYVAKEIFMNTVSRPVQLDDQNAMIFDAPYLSFDEAIEQTRQALINASTAALESRGITDETAIKLTDGRSVAFAELSPATLNFIETEPEIIAKAWAARRMTSDEKVMESVLATAFPGLRKLAADQGGASADTRQSYHIDNAMDDPTRSETGYVKLLVENVPLIPLDPDQAPSGERVTPGLVRTLLMEAIGTSRRKQRRASLDQIALGAKQYLGSLALAGGSKGLAAHSVGLFFFDGAYKHPFMKVNGKPVTVSGFHAALMKSREMPALSPRAQDRMVQIETMLNGLIAVIGSREGTDYSVAHAYDTFNTEPGSNPKRGRANVYVEYHDYYRAGADKTVIRQQIDSAWREEGGIFREDKLANFDFRLPNLRGNEKNDRLWVIGFGKRKDGSSAWSVHIKRGKDSILVVSDTSVSEKDGVRKSSYDNPKLVLPDRTDAVKRAEWAREVSRLLVTGYGLDPAFTPYVVDRMAYGRPEDHYLLLDMIVGFGSAIKASAWAWVNRNENKVEGIEEAEPRIGYLTNSSTDMARRTGFKPRRVSDRDNQDEEPLEDGKQPGRLQPWPSDVWALVERVASELTAMRNMDFNRKEVDGSGGVIYMDSNGTPFRRLFSAGYKRGAVSDMDMNAFIAANRSYMDTYGLYRTGPNGERYYPIPMDRPGLMAPSVNKGIKKGDAGDTPWRLDQNDLNTVAIDEFVASISEVGGESIKDIVVPVHYFGNRDNMTLMRVDSSLLRGKYQPLFRVVSGSKGLEMRIDTLSAAKKVDEMARMMREMQLRISEHIKAAGFDLKTFFEQGVPAELVLPSDMVLDRDYVIKGDLAVPGPVFTTPISNMFSPEVLSTLYGGAQPMAEEQRLEYIQGIVGRVQTPEATGPIGWARFANDGYEVSSAGDSRFSALNARLKDGRTIEEAYQLDVKGYRSQGNDWRLGKGKKPLAEMSPEQLYTAYKALWKQWQEENPELFEQLRVDSAGRRLTDKFASSNVSQARALYELLQESSAQASSSAASLNMATRAWVALQKSGGWEVPKHLAQKVKYAADPDFEKGVIEAMTWAHLIVDSWVSTYGMGPAFNYGSEKNFMKRSAVQFGASQVPTSSPLGLPVITNVAIVMDAFDGAQELHDGLSLEMPWRYLASNVSNGGETGIRGMSSAKTLAQTPSATLKHSEARVTPTVYANNAIYREAVVRALPPELRAEWEQQVDAKLPKPGPDRAAQAMAFEQAFWDMAQKVRSLRNTYAASNPGQYIVDIVSFPSAVKAGKRRINALRSVSQIGDPAAQLLSIPVPTEAIGYQLNASRELDDPGGMSVAPPAQLIQQIGAVEGGLEIAERIEEAEARMTKLFIENLDRELQYDPETKGISYDRLRSKVRDLAREHVNHSSFFGAVNELVSNKDMSIDDPRVRQTLKHILGKWVKQGAVGKRMFGQMYVSVSGYGYEVPAQVEVEANSLEYSAEQMQQMDAWQRSSDEEIETSVDGGVESGAIPSSDRDAARAELLEARAQYDKYVANKGVKAKVTVMRPLAENEVVMPFTHLKNFLPKELWEEGKFMTPDDVRERIMEMGDQLGPERLAKTLELFNKSLDVIIQRTPLTTTAGAMKVRVAGFINDQANTVIVHPRLSWLAGADYDIDQWTIYQRNIIGNAFDPKDPLRLAAKNDPVAAEQDGIFRALLEFYEKPDLAETAPVSPQRVMDIHAALMESVPQEQRDTFYAHDLGSHFLNAERMFEGDKLTGIFANALKGYTYMARAYFKAKRDGKTAEFMLGNPGAAVFDFSNSKGVVSALSDLLQASVDNGKLLALGELGVRTTNVELLIGMVVSGMSLEQALASMFTPEVMDVTRTVQASERIINRRIKKTRFRQELHDQLPKRTDLLQQYDLGNGMMAFVDGILKYNTASAMPMEDALQALESAEMVLGQPMDEFLAGIKPKNPGEFRIARLLERYKNDDYGKQMIAEEMGKWSVFEPAAAVRMIGSVSGWMSALQRTAVIASKSFIDESAPYVAFERTIAKELDKSGLSRKHRGKLTNMLNDGVVDYLLKKGGLPGLSGSTLKVREGMTFDLLHKTGQQLFVDWFSKDFQETLSDLRTDPEKAKQIQANRWLQVVSPGQSGKQRLTLVNRDLLSVPSEKARIMVGFQQLDSIFEGSYALRMTELMSIYAAIKDGFDMSRKSLMPAIAQTHFLNGVSRGIESLSLSVITGKNGQGVAQNGMSLSFAGDGPGALLYGVREEALRSELVQRENPANKFPLEMNDKYFSVKLSNGNREYRKGTSYILERSSTQTINSVDISGMSYFTTPILKTNEQGEAVIYDTDGKPIGTKTQERAAKRTLPESAMTGFLEKSTNLEVLLDTHEVGAYPVGSIIATQYGKARVIEATKEKIVLDTSVDRLADNEPASPYEDASFNGSELKVLLTNPEGAQADQLLASIGMMGGHIGMLADAIYEAYQKSGRRMPTVAYEASWNKNNSGEYIPSQDLVTIDPGFAEERSAYRVAGTVVHEVMHSTLRNIMEADPETLLPEEVAFRNSLLRLNAEVINAIRNDRKNAAKFFGNDVDKVLKTLEETPEELVTRSLTNDRYRQFAMNNGDTRNFLRRFLDAVVALFRSVVLGSRTPAPSYGYFARISEMYAQYLAGMPGRQIDVALLENKRMAESAESNDIISLVDAIGASSEIPVVSGSSSLIAFENREMDRVRENWNAIVARGIYSLYGHSMQIKPGMTPEDVRKFIREEVAPSRSAFEKNNLPNGIIQVLTMEGDMAYNWAQEFPTERGGGIYEASTLAKVMTAINHDDGDFYVRLSGLKNKAQTLRNRKGETLDLSELKLELPNGFVGHNPIVKIRKHGDSVRISLHDVTASDVMEENAYGVRRERMFREHSSWFARGVSQVQYKNVVGDVRRLQTAMTMMALRKANPKVGFMSSSLVRVTTFTVDNHLVHMPDAMLAIDALKRTGSLSGKKNVWNAIPEQVRSYISDPELRRANYGDLSVLDYESLAKELPYDEHFDDDTKKEDRVITPMEMGTLDPLIAQAKGIEGSADSMMRSLTERLRYLKRHENHEDVEVRELVRKELKFVSKAIIDLDALDRLGSGNRFSVSNNALLKLTTAHNVANDMIQFANRIFSRGEAAVTRRVADFAREQSKQIKKLKAGIKLENPALLANELLASVQNTGISIFEPLFRKSTEETSPITVYDHTGAIVSADIRMIHWDRNDKSTAEALRKKDLTEAHLEYANWWLDMQDRYYERLIRHELISENPLMGLKKNEAALKLAIETRMKRLMPVRGIIPAAYKDSGEETNLKEKVKRSWREVSAVDMVPEDLQGVAASKTDMNRTFTHTIANRYLTDLGFGNKQHDGLGHATRVRRMGLSKEEGGVYQLADPKANASLSMDLERMASNFVLAAESKIVHETTTLPVSNAIYHTFSEALGLTESNAPEQPLVEYLRRRLNRLIFMQESQEKTEIPILGANARQLENSFTGTTAFFRLAFHAPVAIASFVTNTLNSAGKAMANDAVGNQFFGLKDLGWGLWTVFAANPLGRLVGHTATREKAFALADHFQLYDFSRQDLIYMNKYSELRKSPGLETVHFMARWTDVNMRIAVMMAQMRKDGSWDAYSLDKDGKVVYDQTKDLRLYNKDGTKKPTADALIRRLRQEIQKDGLYQQPDEGPLVTGYDQRSAYVFKWLTDKYIIGSMDPATQTTAETILGGRLTLQFRKYLPDKVNNWWANEMESDFGGQWKVTKDEDGNDITKWERHVTAGYLSSVARWLDANGKIENLSIEDRRSLVSMLYDVMMFAAIAVATAGIWDDDEDEGFSKNPFVQRIKYASSDLVSASPALIFDTLNGKYSPAFSMVSGWTKAMFGDTNEIKRMIPGYSTYRFIAGE